MSSTPKVDVSFLVADLKYNKNDGVKICEIQHGMSSTFYGDRFSHGEPGIVSTKFINYISQYQVWCNPYQFSEVQIRKMIEQSTKCHCFRQLREITADPVF